MADIRQINSHVSVAPQISVADVKAIAAQGFKTIMNNRPDGESPEQTPSSVIEAEAKANNIDYVYLPIVSSNITAQNIEDFGKVLSGKPGPILAYCRTGTRCTNMWAMAEAGTCGTDQLLKQAQDAGYDLRALVPTLEQLGARRQS
jgi:uncharacterized protein (TIGR01244 family)